MNLWTGRRRLTTYARQLSIAGLIWIGTNPAWAGNIQAGQAVAATCVACHQADGRGMANPGVEPWPALAGLDAGYLAKQLHDFKSGARTSVSMVPFASMLSDTQIADVAAFYASLPLPPGPVPPPANDALLQHGQRLSQYGDWDRYLVSCVSCHGPGNMGIGSEFPRLAGQLPQYLKTQLLAYRDGSRTNDPLNLMGTIARRMTDHDIDAVSLWLAAQPAPDALP